MAFDLGEMFDLSFVDQLLTSDQVKEYDNL